MKILKFIVCFFLILLSFYSKAQSFRTSFSVLGNLNNGKYNFVEKEGLYNTTKNSFNLGLGINTSFYPIKDKNWYLSLGIRLNTAEAYIYAVNQIEGISAIIAPITWGYRWQAITIPIHIGKTIVPFKNSQFNMNVYGGISLGIIMGSMSHYYVIVMKSNFDNELVGAGINQDNNDNVFQKRNLMTLDLGLNFTPIPLLPKLTLGFAYFYNMQATRNVIGTGFVVNVTKQKQQEYYFNFNRRFNNYTFSINYSLGKRNFEQKRNSLGCYKRI